MDRNPQAGTSQSSRLLGSPQPRHALPRVMPRRYLRLLIPKPGVLAWVLTLHPSEIRAREILNEVWGNPDRGFGKNRFRLSVAFLFHFHEFSSHFIVVFAFF